MTKRVYLASLVMLIYGLVAQAQVRQIEMHIDGYLCGN
jgi:hypothetical protein